MMQPHAYRGHEVERGSLNENNSYRVICLSTFFPNGRTGQDLLGFMILENVCYWRQVLNFEKCVPLIV